MSGDTAETTGRKVRRWVTANRLRWVSRLGMLVACGALLLTGTETGWPVLVPALSPLVTLASVLTTRTILWFGWVAVVVLIVVAWRHRWFCRWVCPTGFCADKATWAGRRLGRGRANWPAVGQWIALITLVGACVGYPLLLWLDPLALLSAAFVSLDTAQSATVLWYGSGLAFALLVSLLWPNAWCAKLCPLGGTQDAVHGAGNLARSTLRLGRRPEQTKKSSLRGLRRRTVLGIMIGIVWAAATCKVRGASLGPMRPPGAVDELQFTGLCIRCGNCRGPARRRS